MQATGKNSAMAVVQARMGSSRLPGKMLKRIAGAPLIDHVLGRLHRIAGPDKPIIKIVLATSCNAENGSLCSHVQSRWPKVEIVRGSEADVLSRFLVALESNCSVSTVVRVTGDCPYVNTAALSTMLASHIEVDADITNYRPGYEYVDKGIEVISAKALRIAASHPDLKERDREHVTSIFYRLSGEFHVNYVESEDYLRRGDIRITVDTEADIRFISVLADALGKPPIDTTLRELVDLIDRRPELRSINAGAGRKSTMHEKARIGFRCDGNGEIGLGHIYGSLNLARLLVKELSVGVEFVVRDNPIVVDLISQAGFALETIPADTSPEGDIARLIEKGKESDWAATVVNFCKADLERYGPLFKRIKAANQKLVFQDNPLPPHCYEADLLINALPHPAYAGYDPANHPACLDGLEYFIVPAAMEVLRPQRTRPNGSADRVLVAMGGGDETNITGLVLDALSIAGFNGEVDVVLGAANSKEQLVREQFNRLQLKGQISKGITNMGERIMAADLGFSALGLTTYEMAYLGLPVLIIGGNPLNAAVAETFAASTGAGRFLGQRWQLTPLALADLLGSVLEDHDCLTRMSTAGWNAIGARTHEIPKAVSRLIQAKQ